MDRLTVAGIQAVCRIGVTEAERASVQPIAIDVELPVDAAKAARAERVEAAVDYAALAEAVKRIAEGRPYVLLETLAETVADAVLQEFEVPRVRVRVVKRALAGIDYAAVEIERTRVRAARFVARDTSSPARMVPARSRPAR